MNISAISSYRYNNNYSSNVKNSFNGKLEDKAVNRVLNMLKPKVTATTISSMEGLKSIMDNLVSKWKRNSVGMMVIPEKDLAGFVGKEVKDYRGLCVAVGDKFGPMETWGNCFEAITVLIPKSVLP